MKFEMVNERNSIVKKRVMVQQGIQRCERKVEGVKS
jgi:hypothetical protein